MANANKVILIGNLTKDVELRYTPSGTAVATIGVAVNRTFKGADGEQKKDTLFINCVAWQKSAETLNQYVHKGDPLYIEGRLQSRAWEDKEGKRKSTIEVVIENFQFLKGRDKQEPAEQAPADDEPLF